MKVKSRFTFVVTYTFDGQNQVVADAFRDYLKSPIRDGGVAAIDIDQSTYATKIELTTKTFLVKVRNKLESIYKEKELERNPNDVVDVLSNPYRAFEEEGIKSPEHIYQFDVFDFE